MIQTRKSRSVQATKEKIEKLSSAKAVKLNDYGKPLTYPDIATATGRDEKTVKNFFYGKRVDESPARAITQFLGLQLADVVDIRDLEPLTVFLKPEPNFLSAAKQICQAMLAEKQRLTTNPLTTGEGVTFELKDVYVPLGLLERKRQDKCGGDVSPRQGSKLYEPTEYAVTQKFEHHEFLEQVIRLGESPKSKGKRIAIIGEPGAGKTTLLQQMADWVFAETEQDVAIWVSLADLQGRTIEEYLLQLWLKDALKTAWVTPEMENVLVELFNSGRVWLLLDGVDEMAVDNPLQAIASQICGWLTEARVVLTCRLNVWDVGKNALENFDVYRNLNFTSEQVKQFIDKWFLSCPKQGQRLWAELEQPGKERIGDAVKNPLRLALLCRTWLTREGGLPETKADLYRQFTEALYKWKQETFPTSSDIQRQLNGALGRLALEAIAQSSSRFRLTRSFICKILGEPDKPLFQLAMQLGWLNQVGVAAENPNDPVYAFFHPTFEEYFAALAIDDWHFFLNHVPHNPAQGIYRIFEPQWKEVILLWLGREDVAKEQKEEFIEALIEFEDKEWGFYWYRAYFLAAVATAEFKNCRFTKKIVEKIVEWDFNSPIPICNEVSQVIKEVDREEVIAAIVQQLDQYGWDLILLVSKLIHFDSNNQKAIAILLQLLETARGSSLAIAASSLGSINPGNQRVIAALVQVIETSQYSEARMDAARSLRQIDPDNEIAIAAQIELVQSFEKSVLFDLFWYLLEDDNWDDIKGNSTAITALVQLIQTTQDELTLQVASERLGKINPGNETAITTLIHLIKTTEDENIQQRVASSLGKIGAGSETALYALLDLLANAKNEQTRKEAAESLAKVGKNNQIVRSALLQLIQTANNEHTRLLAAYSLGHIDPGNTTAIGFLVQLLSTSQDTDTLIEVAQSLEKIAPDNQTAIPVLLRLVQTAQDQSTLERGVSGLWLMKPGSRFPKVVTLLKDYLTEQDLEYNYSLFVNCYEVIWNYAQNMTYPDFYEAWHAKPSTTHPEVPETSGSGINPLTKSLNLANLPQSLNSAIADDSHLVNSVKLICINGGNFIDQDNPAAKIYTTMVKGGCPKCSDGTPKTMPELQAYWDLLTIESDRTIVLVFYHSEEFSNTFLDTMSKFDGAICVVTGKPMGNFPLQKFSASQCQLVENILGWIRAISLES